MSEYGYQAANDVRNSRLTDIKKPPTVQLPGAFLLPAWIAEQILLIVGRYVICAGISASGLVSANRQSAANEEFLRSTGRNERGH